VAKILLVAIVAVIAFAAVQMTRQRLATQRAKKLKNSVAATPPAIDAGRQLYGLHCEKCHGIKGDGKGEKASELFEEPTDFTNAKQMDRLADGELFVPIMEGKKPMPAFGDKLNEEQAWELVDYVRTFARPPNQEP
jgi:mono/diheme cytochrome c family protein